MHRSGTSCMAGSLQQQGLFLGKHNTSAPWNKRGNRENVDVMKLQVDILEKSGGSWHQPPPTVRWLPEHVEAAKGLLAEYADHENWGFKDPRTVLTFDGWQQLVPDLQPVGIFRHPLRVARSLETRNQMALDESVSLWRAYNERLLEVWRAEPFPLVDFDEEETVLREKLIRAGRMIGLDEPPPDEPFFLEELRQSPAEGPPLPAEVEALHATLRELAL
jgi:hypothetical protein